jgi:hypothetical protein
VYIEDLSTRAYFAHGDRVRAVGWLEADHPFALGSVSDEFLRVLKAHIAKAFQPVLYMGLHRCSFCEQQGRIQKGHSNLLIPTTERLYVAPQLVVHYIENHGYQPPLEFLAAVLGCPEQQSDAYFELLRPFECCWRRQAEPR